MITDMVHPPKSWVTVQENELSCSNRDILPLPLFEIERGIRKPCIADLSVTVVVKVACNKLFAKSFVRWKFFCHEEQELLWSIAAKEVASLIFNICVTAYAKVLGFIYATSLRWALYHKGQCYLQAGWNFYSSSQIRATLT